jgi:hypothetical protein
MQPASLVEALMIKTALLVCSICATAGGTAFWMSPEMNSRDRTAVAGGGMPSIEELNARAGSHTLVDQTVREAF